MNVRSIKSIPLFAWRARVKIKIGNEFIPTMELFTNFYLLLGSSLQDRLVT